MIKNKKVKSCLNCKYYAVAIGQEPCSSCYNQNKHELHPNCKNCRKEGTNWFTAYNKCVDCEDFKHGQM